MFSVPTALDIGTAILALIPGFIFIEIIERHLLREAKPQFQKLLQILLASAFLWILTFWSFWLFSEIPDSVIESAAILFKTEASKDALPTIEIKKQAWSLVGHATGLFFSACMISVLLANLIGVIRKYELIDRKMIWLTGRDWFPQVAFRFYKAHLNTVIEFECTSGHFIATLVVAPDAKDDPNIIVAQVNQIIEGRIVPLTHIKSMLVKVVDISTIRCYNTEYEQKTTGGSENASENTH